MDHADLARIVAQAVTTALTQREQAVPLLSVLHSKAAAPPFPALAREWLAEARHRPSWRREIERLLARELQALPPQPTRENVAGVLRAIRAPSVHNHCLAIVGAVYRWGLATGRCGENPAFGFRRRPIPPRQRVLSLTELRAVWADGDPITRLLVLSGARAGEIGGLQWAEVGEDRLSLPGSRCKNHRPHMIPLTEPMRDCLPAPRPGRPFVFGRRKGAGFSGWTKLKRALPALSEPWTLHDLRRSAATHWAELGLADADLIGLALGHVRPGVRGVYNRSERWPERVRLAGEWASLLGKTLADR